MDRHVPALHHPHHRLTRNRRRLLGRGATAQPRTWRTRIPLLDVLIAVTLFAGALSLNLSHADTWVFHPDETRWLNRSYFVEDYWDPFGSTWQDYYITRGQPPLGSYMIGIGQLIQGGDLHPNLVWDFYYGFDSGPDAWNPGAGAMPSPENLDKGRNTSAFVGALVVVAAYFLFAGLTNRVGGALGGAILLFHPLQEYVSAQSLSDNLLNLTFALALIAGLRLARTLSWTSAAMLGIFLGLGGATKLTPLLLTLPLAALGAFLFIRPRLLPRLSTHSRRDRMLGRMLMLQPVIGFCSFVAVYPYLWPNPIVRTYNLFNFRRVEMANQASINENVQVETRLEALGRIGRRLGTEFQSYSHLQDRLNGWFGWTLDIRGIDLIVALVGLGFIILLVMRNGFSSPAGLVAIIAAAEAGAIVAGLRSDLYRYYVPLILVECLSISVTIGVFWQALVVPHLPIAWRRFVNRLSALDPERASLRPTDAPHQAPGRIPQATGPRPWRRPTAVRGVGRERGGYRLVPEPAVEMHFREHPRPY